MTVDTRERSTAYSKELLDTMPAMREDSLPSPSDIGALEKAQSAPRGHNRGLRGTRLEGAR